MARKSPYYYIAPSVISIIPNANESPNDLAVSVVRGTKIKVYHPYISDLRTDDANYQEWTLAGRNRRLNDPNQGGSPYAIYARLSKTDHSDGYIVFATKLHVATTGKEEDDWKDPYVLSPNTSSTAKLTVDKRTWDELPENQAKDGRQNYWWVKIGDVSAPKEGQRTVDLDTGILGTDQFNNDWEFDDGSGGSGRHVQGEWIFEDPVTFWDNVDILGNLTVAGEAFFKGLLRIARAIIDDIRSSDHTGDGLADTGWHITNAWGGTGSSGAVFDYLTVRKKMIVNTLEVKQTLFSSGDLAQSCASSEIYRTDYYEVLPDGSRTLLGYSVVKVPWMLRGISFLLRKTVGSDESLGVYSRKRSVRLSLTPEQLRRVNRVRCYFLAKDGEKTVENWWRADDLARCQTMNVVEQKRDTYVSGNDDHQGNVYWWRKVHDVSWNTGVPRYTKADENGEATNKETVDPAEAYINDNGIPRQTTNGTYKESVDQAHAPVKIDGRECHWFEVDYGYEAEHMLDSDGNPIPTGFCDLGSDLPAAGDKVVQFGNTTDPDRMNITISEINGVGNPDAPGIKMYRGIYTFDLSKSWWGTTQPPIVISPSSKIRLFSPSFEWGTEYGVVRNPVDRPEIYWTEISPEYDDYTTSRQLDSYPLYSDDIVDEQGNFVSRAFTTDANGQRRYGSAAHPIPRNYVRKCHYYDRVSHNGSYWLCSMEESYHWRVKRGYTVTAINNGADVVYREYEAISKSVFIILSASEKEKCEHVRSYTADEPTNASNHWQEQVQKGGFMSRVFIRSNVTPQTPLNTTPAGTTYNTSDRPVPPPNTFAPDEEHPEQTVTETWSDGVPAGSEILWSSTAWFYSYRNHSPWTTPAPETDTSDQDVEFSPNTEQPAAPCGDAPIPQSDTHKKGTDGSGSRANGSGHSADWYDPAKDAGNTHVDWDDMIWRAERKIKNGEYAGQWVVTRIKGESGIGHSVPSYIESQEAWSNEASTQSATTPPSDCQESDWKTYTPGNTGNRAYLWRRSRQMVLKADDSGYEPDPNDPNWIYTRLSGTNGTSINTKGTVAAVVAASGTLPTTGMTNGDLGIRQGDPKLYKATVNSTTGVASWSQTGMSAAADGDSYVVSKDCTVDLDGDGTSTNVKDHLIMWSAEAHSADSGKGWIDLGQFKGESGVTYYMHLAWAKGITLATPQSPASAPKANQTNTPNASDIGKDSNQNPYFSISPMDGYSWMGILIDTDTQDTQDSTGWRYYTWQDTQGQSAIRLALDNEHEDFLYSDAGLVAPAGGATSQARLYVGSSRVTEGIEWSVSCNADDASPVWKSPSDGSTSGNAVAGISSGGLLTVTGITADTAKVKVRARYDGEYYYAEFTANKTTQNKYDLKVTPNAIAYNKSDQWVNKTLSVSATLTNAMGAQGSVTNNISTGNTGYLRLFMGYVKANGTIEGLARQKNLTPTVYQYVGETSIDEYIGVYFELRRYNNSSDSDSATDYRMCDYETVEIVSTQNGKTLSHFTKRYKATAAETPVPEWNGGSEWSTSISASGWSATNRFLYCRERPEYQDGTSGSWGDIFLHSVWGASEGVAGADGYALEVSPSSLILESNLNGSTEAVSYTNNTVKIRILKGATAASLTCSLVTASGTSSNCTVNSSNIQIDHGGSTTISTNGTSYGTEASVTLSGGIDISGDKSSGYFTVRVATQDGKFSRDVRINFYVNRAPAFTRKIAGGIESALGQQVTYSYDDLGNVIKNAYTADIETSAKGLRQEFKEETGTAGQGNKNLFGFHKDCEFSGSTPFIQGYGIAGNDPTGLRVYNLGFNGRGGVFSVSFQMKASSGSGRVLVSICDKERIAKLGTEGPEAAPTTVSVNTDWESYELHFDVPDNYVTGNSMNGYIDFRKYNGLSSDVYLYIRHLKVERGTDVTDFCPADEDIIYRGQGQLLRNIRIDSLAYNLSSYDEKENVYVIDANSLFSSYAPWGDDTNNNRITEYNYITENKDPNVADSGIYLEAGKCYTLSYWAKTTNGNSNAPLRIRHHLYDPNIISLNAANLYEDNSTGISESIRSDGYSRVTLSSEWKQYFVRFYVATYNSRRSFIALRLTTDDNQTLSGTSVSSYRKGYIYICDIKLEEGFAMSNELYSSLVEQNARRISMGVSDGLKRTGIDIENGLIELTADKVKFSYYDGSTKKSDKVWIDPTTGALHAVDGNFSGHVTATSGSFTGDIYAEGGTIGGFGINQTDLKNINYDAGITIQNAENSPTKSVRIGADAKDEMSGNKCSMVAESKGANTYNTALYLDAEGGDYNYAFHGSGNGVLNGLVYGFKTQYITIPYGSTNVKKDIVLEDGSTVILSGTHSNGHVVMAVPRLSEVRKSLGIPDNVAATTSFAIEFNVLNLSTWTDLSIGFRGATVYSGLNMNSDEYPFLMNFDDEFHIPLGGYVDDAAIQLAVGDYMKLLLVYAKNASGNYIYRAYKIIHQS